MHRLVALLLAIGLVGAACSSSSDTGTPTVTLPAQEGGRPIVFVTDFGLGLSAGWRDGQSDVDDAMAVALALDSHDFDVLALVTTFGNTFERPQATRAIPGFAAAAGAELPVLRGSPRSIPAVAINDASGDTIDDACMTDGIARLGSILREHDDVAVLAIAPLSPLACLAMNDPQALDSITDVVALMGVEPDTELEVNGHAVSDFNFGIDVEAARIVVEDTDLPLTFVTFETSSDSLITSQQLGALEASGTALAEYFTTAAARWVSSWEQTFGEDGIHPWDANTAWWLLHPEAFSCTETGVQVDIPSTDTPGASIDDTSSHLYVGDDYDGRRVRACTGYADDETRATFVEGVLDALQGAGGGADDDQ